MNDKLKIKFSKPDKRLHEFSGKNIVINTFDDWDNIPDPVPAKRSIPEWFKQQGPMDSKNGLIKTVKKCVPFLDALTTGYVIKFCSDLQIDITDRQVVYDGPGKIFCSLHPKKQFDKLPIADSTVLKFSSPWVIQTPPGWSCLFLHPLNSFNDKFETLSGIVDTDTYRLPVNFPFIAKSNNITLDVNTPMVQVIPFRRQEFELEIDTVNYDQWMAHQHAIGDQWTNEGYKDLFHQKKKYN